jgi:Activator of Hsp90 ATPase homolog 1-like protein
VSEPLHFAFEVSCAPDVAFDLWTAGIGTWWPRGHTVSADPSAEIVLEPGLGGRIFERTPSGDEFDWGEVTTWEPPRRLGYLWHLRRDRADATDVEIRFVHQGAGTVVEIEHSGWERLGADGETWRDRNRGGWGGLLPHYQSACAAAHGERGTDG